MKKLFICALLIGTRTLYLMQTEKIEVKDPKKGLELLLALSEVGALNKYQQEELNKIKQSLENIEFIITKNNDKYVKWIPTGVSVNKKLEKSYCVND